MTAGHNGIDFIRERSMRVFTCILALSGIVCSAGMTVQSQENFEKSAIMAMGNLKGPLKNIYKFERDLNYANYTTDDEKANLEGKADQNPNKV